MTHAAGSPLRVVHVATERGWRGGERQVLWLAEGLARLGHNNVIAARAGEPLAERARAAGLEVLACDPRFEGDPLTVLALRRAMQRADVLHAHTGHAVGLGALATLGSGRPMVVTRRVDFPLRGNALTRWKYGRAAAVIAISRAVAAVLVKSGVPAGEITIVPDGVDLSRTIEPATRDTLWSIGVPDGAPLVVQVAALVPHKDPLTFVRAFHRTHRELPEAHGIMAGDGPLRADVERERDALGLGDALHIVGYRSDADALIAAADVVTLSSREEGMGSVLLDACMLGKAIVATRAGGIPDIIVDDVSGILAPVGNADALGLEIASVLIDRVLAARLGAEARHRSVAFSVERMAAATAAVYERALTSRRA